MRRFTYPLVLAAALAAVPALAQPGAPFTGFHVDGILGYDDNHNTNSNHGLLYGGGVGYDLQLGRLVAGVDGEASGSTARQCYAAIGGNDRRACLRSDRDLYVGGRLGTLLTPRALLYVKGGYTNYERARAVFENEDLLFRAHNHLDGGRVGAGLEYALTPRMFVKTEYRYSRYDGGLDRHQLVGGAGLRF